MRGVCSPSAYRHLLFPRRFSCFFVFCFFGFFFPYCVWNKDAKCVLENSRIPTAAMRAMRCRGVPVSARELKAPSLLQQPGKSINPEQSVCLEGGRGGRGAAPPERPAAIPGAAARPGRRRRRVSRSGAGARDPRPRSGRRGPPGNRRGGCAAGPHPAPLPGARAGLRRRPSRRSPVFRWPRSHFSAGRPWKRCPKSSDLSSKES